DASIDGALWTLRSDGDRGLVIGRDGVTVVVVGLGERLQGDARTEMQALRRRGLRVHLASGDTVERAHVVGAQLGIDDARGALRPEDKAALVEQLGRERVCFVGDGINDAAAFAVAGIAGTPALDRPQLPARADFYTVSAGLGPIDALFAIGTRYDRAARTALWFAVVYNVVAVALALAGVLSPLACALLMPGSSIVVVLLVRAVFNHTADTTEPA
ncbi:MAG TPA: HAD-IC family P-type ATPase, partial [Myxococcota bacterium]